MSGYDTETIALIIVLSVLILIYLYLLLSPNQPKLPNRPKNYVIQRDTKENYETFLKSLKSDYENYDWMKNNKFDDPYEAGEGLNNTNRKPREDDFFLDTSMFEGGGGGGGGDYRKKDSRFDDRYEEEEKQEPIIPSTNYLCEPNAWLSIRSELNYKYLWMHGNEEMWMGASANMETPIHRKAFIIHPIVHNNCTGSEGWVLLQEGDSNHYITMIAPFYDNTTNLINHDAWAITLGTTEKKIAFQTPSYHFLLEKDGYLLNRGLMAFVNVLPENEYPVRGHSSSWKRNKPAGREFGAAMTFQLINSSYIINSIAKEKKEEEITQKEDEKLISKIQLFTNPNHEKRVISFGLYGTKPKYNQGAIRNAELVKTYFPGWICRFYVTNDVLNSTIDRLKELGSEIELIPSGMGYTSGMFWRFLVADDPTIDRYIIRDVDSRLNARDRIAVEEWIQLKYPIHIIRDHVNHCLVMNGGMWGGVKGAITGMKGKILEWENRNEYMADLHFLDKMIWPEIKHQQVSHDAYCCDRYPHTRPFPTKRYMNYQHVGQVFNEHDEPRLTDIDGFIRGVPTPSSCRKESDWIYG